MNPPLALMTASRSHNWSQTFITISGPRLLKAMVILFFMLQFYLMDYYSTMLQTKSREMQSGMLERQMSGVMWSKFSNSQAFVFHLVWKVLLLHVWSPCSYLVNLGLHNLAQSTDVPVGVQPDKLKKVVG